MWRSLFLGASGLALAFAGCQSGAGSGARVERAAQWSAPADDVGEPCADVSDLRVCWPSETPVLVARTVPPFPAPTAPGFRCTGSGAARTCASRDALAGGFVCDHATCAQRDARQPDEGEWTCSDEAGIAVCVGGERGAGVSSAGTEPGWMCGDRHGAADGLGGRVCVDLSPDFPDGRAAGFRCRWSYDHGVARLCARDDKAHGAGDACDAGRPCVLGMTCAAGRCVPPRPRPSCALDADCRSGVCLFGSCGKAGP